MTSNKKLIIPAIRILSKAENLLELKKAWLSLDEDSRLVYDVIEYKEDLKQKLLLGNKNLLRVPLKE